MGVLLFFEGNMYTKNDRGEVVEFPIPSEAEPIEGAALLCINEKRETISTKSPKNVWF
ncbi:hypothetical protein [Runella sp.]|uniref:hypothetical protein n=1 Tax=Runella sp. TaxID=1960881 RepID=UPI0030171866